MNIELMHAGNMLPDYWQGHDAPVVQIAISGPMTIQEIRDEVKSEVNQMWDHYEHIEEGLAEELLAAADRIAPADRAKPADYKFFSDVEVVEDGDIVYAFFVAAKC